MNKTEAQANQETATAFGIPQENVAKAEACSHDRDPGKERIGDQKQRAAERKDGLPVKNVPKRCQAAETLRCYRIKKVVRSNDQQAERRENFCGQVQQRCEHDHAQAQHPENGEDEERAGPVPLEEKETRELRQGAAVVIPEVPAVKAKTGAQKCVIQRVKKSAVVVRERSVGENDMAAALVKSRT